MKKISVFVIVAALFSACAPKDGKDQAAEHEILPIVRVISAGTESVAQDNVYSSTIQANIINNIAPQSGGRIQKLNVEVGDMVKAGDILVEMDRVQLDQAELRLRNAETELARVRELYAQGGISQSDFESLELSYKVSKTTYENLLENTILRSPVDGVITARNYDRGDLYGMAQPIYTVQQITPVKILVGVSETDYTLVKKGDKVKITVDAVPGRTFNGNIVRLYPTMDAASHTFTVEIRVPNIDRTLRPGMYARATISFGENERVVVPDEAIVKMQGSGQRSVYILKDNNTVELRVVKLGRHFDNKYEIISGIESGSLVVVKGQAALKSGIKVEVR